MKLFSTGLVLASSRVITIKISEKSWVMSSGYKAGEGVS